MKTSLHLAIAIVVVSAPVLGQTYGFDTVSGRTTATQNALDGWVVADQVGSNRYQGYVGELGLMFNDAGIDPGGLPPGTFRGDSGGEYEGYLGLTAFCIDADVSLNGVGAGDTQIFQAYHLTGAEGRIAAEAGTIYQPGSLARVAYLLDIFYGAAAGLGDLGAATMQAAIWEVLEDPNPNLAFGSGGYFLRNNTGDATVNDRADQMIALADQWFLAAEAAGWGGAGYSPVNSVVFWIDPESVEENQSLVSFLPAELDLEVTPAPEPGASSLVAVGLCLVARRRRR